MSASPDPTSPSKFEGLGGPVVVTEKCSVGELSSTCCGVGSPPAVSCFSGELPEDVLPFSPSTAKGFVAGAGAAGFAEVDDGALPRLGSAEEVGLVNFTFFFFEGVEGVNHSRPAGMVICGHSRCRSRSSTPNVKGVLQREVAQAVEVPTTLEATELGRGM